MEFAQASAAVGMEHLSHDNSHMSRRDCDPLRCSKSLVSDVNGIFASGPLCPG